MLKLPCTAHKAVSRDRAYAFIPPQAWLHMVRMARDIDTDFSSRSHLGQFQQPHSCPVLQILWADRYCAWFQTNGSSIPYI